MNSEDNGKNNSMNLVPCRLRPYGCTDLYPLNQTSKHLASQAHVNSMINRILSLKSKYDDALIDVLTNPMEASTLSSSANTTKNEDLQIFEELNIFMAQNIPPANTTAIASDGGTPSINQTYSSIYHSSRDSILRMDRDRNHSLNLQAYQEQFQLNKTALSSLSTRLTELSSDEDHENHRPEQDEILPPADEQSTIQFHTYSNAILQIESDAKPVSTDGFLVWHIDKISAKIDEAIKGNKLYVNSPPFQTSIHGHRLWGRIFFNGKTDHKFISVHVHLNLPFHEIFDGNIKFVLVDQNTDNSPQHYTKSCTGKMNDVGSCLGFDIFIDQSILREKGNRYVCNDSIYFLIYVKQINQEKFPSLPKNVQHALKELLF